MYLLTNFLVYDLINIFLCDFFAYLAYFKKKLIFL